MKTKVTSSVPQTAERLCFIPPSFTMVSYLYPPWDMGISANFELSKWVLLSVFLILFEVFDVFVLHSIFFYKIHTTWV